MKVPSKEHIPISNKHDERGAVSLQPEDSGRYQTNQGFQKPPSMRRRLGPWPQNVAPRVLVCNGWQSFSSGCTTSVRLKVWPLLRKDSDPGRQPTGVGGRKKRDRYVSRLPRERLRVLLEPHQRLHHLQGSPEAETDRSRRRKDSIPCSLLKSLRDAMGKKGAHGEELRGR